MIPDHIVNDLKAMARIEDVAMNIHGATQRGKVYTVNCPNCKKIDGLQVVPAKQLAKCWKCGLGASQAVGYLMKICGKTYPEALRYIADLYKVVLP
ncbi:MAG TPA: CHC2 zinc finger domain-containing protein [Flavobacteriales bacterium]|nr:CHC2 zinc finger domain-containing protein [Flavobacteriales bacterium]